MGIIELGVAGIRQRSVTRRRGRQERYTVWEPRFRNGLCRTGQYFVGRPATRRVTEHYEQSVYDLQPKHIKVTPPPSTSCVLLLVIQS